MKQRFGVVGIVAAAILASSCCLAPLLLAGLGVAGVGFSAALAPYRPYFIALTTLLLAAAWYVVLRRSRAPSSADAPSADCCALDARCALGGSRRRNTIVLSVISIGALAMLAFPQIELAVIARSHSHKTLPTAAAGVQTLSLQIRGWSCEACGAEVEKQLSQVPGVVGAHAEYAKGTVKVLVGPGRVPEQQLRDRVDRMGYRVIAIRRQP